MTISFFEPGDVPQPPDKVKIELLEAKPYQDRWRLKVRVHVTPFQQRPNLELVLLHETDSPEEQPVANLSIIETMHPRMEFTMHIRGVHDPAGQYRLRASLYYRDQLDENAGDPPPIHQKDRREFTFSIPVDKAE
jgi:hypothetical protein